MVDRSLRYRHQTVSCLLSEEEHRQLREICTELGLVVREVLMVGCRHARTRLIAERRRQRQIDE
jgi:hypothetical protein